MNQSSLLLVYIVSPCGWIHLQMKVWVKGSFMKNVDEVELIQSQAKREKLQHKQIQNVTITQIP